MKQGFSLKRILKAHPEYWYVLFVPAYLLCFSLVERLVPSSADYWVVWCPLDDCIPFLEGFVVPYCLWYPLLVFTGLYLMFLDVPEFKRYMQFLILGFGFALVFGLIVPNGQNLRPAVFPRENVFTWVIGRLYAADTNTNVLPSMHATGSVACAVAASLSRRLRKWFFWPIALLAVAICAATVCIKQHSILDVFAAIAVSFVIWCVLYLRKDLKEKKEKKAKR